MYNTDSNITQWKNLQNDHNSSLSLKPSSNLLNNTTPENSNEPEKNYLSIYDIEEMYNIEIPHKNKSLYLYINTCSLNKNFDDLQHLLNCTKKIDIIPISETRITKQVFLLNNLNLNNSFEFTPTETTADGTLLHIANHLS